MTEVAVAQLTEDDARELTAKIYGALEVAWNLIVDAYKGRAWVAMGYKSWDVYCREEFNGSRLRLPREERQEVVTSLREAGLSVRAIASATGVAYNTALKDSQVTQTESAATNVPPAPVTGIDGKTYSPHQKTVAQEPDPVATVPLEPPEVIDAEIVEEEDDETPQERMSQEDLSRMYAHDKFLEDQKTMNKLTTKTVMSFGALLAAHPDWISDIRIYAEGKINTWTELYNKAVETEKGKHHEDATD